MSTFVTIKHVQDYQKVSYYSVCLEGEEKSLFEHFLERMQELPEVRDELVQMVTWIKKIGDDIGAKDRYFRHEGAISDAKALPPPARYIEGKTGSLRLYCLVANEHVVFLFDGGIKTKQRAQQCPNVSAYFRQANKLSKAINQCFAEKDIEWNDSDDDIVFSEDLEIFLP